MASQACYHEDIVVMSLFLLIAVILTGLLVVFGVQLGRALRRFRIRKKHSLPSDLPTVSICIPARNETHAMAQCLERALASSYEKLEIIVYDDRSGDDTPILIKSFAQAGVRFVPGTALPEGWLGRNHALQILAQEASGEYLLFMDVDTFIRPHTVSELVAYMHGERLDMISVIPGRDDTRRASVLFGPLRYFWELVLSRPHMPATGTAAWLVDREVLENRLGGFAPYKNNVQPEAQFAALLGVQRYHCLLNTDELGVTYEKKWHSQVETSKRLLYPLVGGNWRGAFIGVCVLLLLNLPFLTVLSGFLFGWTIVQVKALWLLLAFMALYAVYTNKMWHGKWWLGGMLWPVVIFQELTLLVASIWGYASGTITWKGRSITASPLRVDGIRLDQ